MNVKIDTSNAQRATFKGHSRPNEFVYLGTASMTVPNMGPICRIESSGHGINVIRISDGLTVESFGVATKFWAAPVPTEEATEEPTPYRAADQLMADGAAPGAAVQQEQINAWLYRRGVTVITSDAILAAKRADELEAHELNAAHDDGIPTTPGTMSIGRRLRAYRAQNAANGATRQIGGLTHRQIRRSFKKIRRNANPVL